MRDGASDMIFYGLHSLVRSDITDWFTSRDDAEAALADVLLEEPEWDAEVVRVEFGSALVTPVSRRCG